MPQYDLESLRRRLLARKPLGVTDDDCWPWPGGETGKGYGQFRVGNTKKIGVHVAAFLVFKGSIPAGHDVCHSCDNPSCWNPAHLWLGTRQRNMQDAVAKGRAPLMSRRTHCFQGHPLTPDNVYLYPNGDRKCRRCQQLSAQRRGASMLKQGNNVLEQ